MGQHNVLRVFGQEDGFEVEGIYAIDRSLHDDLAGHWVDWRKNGMEFCAVSDNAASDLGELQHLIDQ